MRYLLIPFLLSGCTGYSQWYADQIQSAYGPRCEAMGFKAGTPERAMCAEQLHAQERQFGIQSGAASMYLLQQAQPRPMVNTTCSQVGNFVNCTSQ